jgi:hypothetical protein
MGCGLGQADGADRDGQPGSKVPLNLISLDQLRTIDYKFKVSDF